MDAAAEVFDNPIDPERTREFLESRTNLADVERRGNYSHWEACRTSHQQGILPFCGKIDRLHFCPKVPIMSYSSLLPLRGVARN